MNWQDEISWNEEGLVPAIAQDATSGRVLTLAWMNQNALEASLQESRAVYWSRRRAKLCARAKSPGTCKLLEKSGSTVMQIRFYCWSTRLVVLRAILGASGVSIACSRTASGKPRIPFCANPQKYMATLN